MTDLWKHAATEFWDLIDEKQKIAYLDAAASNCLPTATALVALNDKSEEVRVAALAAVTDLGDGAFISALMLGHPNWYVREAALRTCEKFQHFPAEKTIVQVFAQYPEIIPRICEIRNAYRTFLDYFFKEFSIHVWCACRWDDETKIECIKEEDALSNYKLYCCVYEQWAQSHPDVATQTAEEQCACLLFKTWLERYADADRTTESEAAAET